MQKGKIWRRVFAAALSAVLLLSNLYIPGTLPTASAAELSGTEVHAEPVVQTDPDASEASEASTGEETEKEDPSTEAPDADPEQPENPTGETTGNTDPTGETTESTDPTGEATESTDPTGETTESTDPTGETTESTDPTGETTESTDPTGETAESTDPTGETVPEGYYSVVASDGTTCLVPVPETAEQTPLADIIREDDSGRKMLYVTLRDSEGRVVATSDPSSAVDEYYASAEAKREALQGPVTVSLSFAAVSGIPTEGYYCLDLPKELVPQSAVNPSAPVELFQSGTVRAFGGIYSNEGSAEKPWRLMLHFAVTGEAAEISAGFQYSAAVSGELGDQPLDAVDFGAAGVLSFGEEASAPQVPEGFFAVMTLDGMTYMVPVPSTTEEVPIENIIKEDENGRKKMFVTMRDNQHRVVSTTDPSFTVDEYYTNEETYRVALKEPMTVYLNFAAIKEAALEGGVSEDVYYYLDLPKELVPDLTNDKGQNIVDPEEPIELFHNGVIRAFGGIYSNEGNPDKPWRLKINFADTADQVEITGGFQYTVTISESLEYDHLYDTVDFGGAGQLSFVTEKDSTITIGNYSLSVKGVWDETDSTEIEAGSANTKMDWSVVLTDSGVDPDGNPSPSIDNTMTLDMSEGHGMIGDRSGSGNVTGFDYYYGVCPYTVTVTYTDGTETVLTPSYMGYWAFYDPVRMGHEGNFWGQFILKIEAYPDSSSTSPHDGYVAGINGSGFIANQLKVTFQHVNWTTNPYTYSPVTDIVKWEIKLSTLAYDNAGINEGGYGLTGSLDPIQEGEESLTASGSLYRNYGSPVLSAHAVTGQDKTIGGLPQYITTCADIDQNGKHGGNYISFEYKPNEYNQLGADYFVTRKSFSFSSNIATDYYSSYYRDTETLFQKINIAGKDITWQRIGTLGSAMSLLYNDPVLQLQINQLFPNQTVWLYRSSQPYEGNKYYWIVISNDLYTSAQPNQGSPNSWWGYSKQSDISYYSNRYGRGEWTRKPSTWQVYILNTAGKDVYLEFDEYLEKYTGPVTPTSGGVTNRITVSNGQNSTNTTTGWGSSNNPIASLKGEYVTARDTSGKEIDNMIRWEMELDLSNYDFPHYYNYEDCQFQLFLKLPKALTFRGGCGIFDSENPDLVYSSYYFYISNRSSSGWDQCGYWQSSSPTSDYDTWKLAGFNYNDSSNYDLYVLQSNYSSHPINSSRMDNGKIKIAFYTYVNGENWSNNTLECEVSIHDFTYDMISSNRGYYPFWSLEAHAKGGVPQPRLYKSSNTVSQKQEDTDLHKTKLHYYVSSSLSSQGYYYNGTWSVSDSMEQSRLISQSNGTETYGFHPARFVTLEDFHFYVSPHGPSLYGEFTKEQLAEAVEAKDHKVTNTYTLRRYEGDYSEYTVTAELTYSGNMDQGFTLRLKGLENCSYAYVDYNVVLDDAALFKELGESHLDDLYTVELRNCAASGWMSPSSSRPGTVNRIALTAALALEKEVKNPEDADGFTQHYDVKATVGASPTPYLRITDYVSKYQAFFNWNKDSAEIASCEGAEQLAALAKSTTLDPDKLTVAVKLPTSSSSSTIYKDGAFTEGWEGSVLSVGEEVAEDVKAEFPGALYHLVLKRANSSYIPAGTVVTISYDAALDMEAKVVDTDGKETTFRMSSYYPGGVLAITNSVQGARAYKGIDQVPDQPEAAANARSGWVDTENMELVCDAGAVGGKYLYVGGPQKSSGVSGNAGTETNVGKDKHYNYLISYQVPSSGKELPKTIELTDIMYVFNNKKNMDKLTKEGKTAAEATDILEQLDYLFRANLTIYDLTVYFGENRPVSIIDDQPVYKQELEPIYSDTVQLTADPTRVLTIAADDLSKGFTLSLAPVEFGDDVAASYDVKIDWTTFYQEAAEQGLLTDGLLLGTIQPELDLKNGLWSPGKDLIENSESTVEVFGTTAGKRLVSEDANAGTASWEVTANTGYVTGDSLVIRDAVEIQLPENTELTEDAGATVLEAVKNTMSLGNVKLVLSGEEPLTLYENGGLTEAAMAAGWEEANIALTADSLAIEVTVSNQTGVKLVDSEQTYVLTYDTALDKDAYFKALTSGGLSAEDIEKAVYVLSNTANTERGGTESSASATATQRPGFPLEGSKSGAQRGGNPQMMDWTLTAGTGDAARENLEIRDVLAVDSSDAEDASLMGYISIKEMVITLQAGDGEPVTVFDRAGKTDLLEQYHCTLEKLSALDGDPEGALPFDENGVYGFRLSFGEAVPKDTVVTVTYSTAFDRIAYLKAGGENDRVIDFINTISVSAKGSDDLITKADSNVILTETMTKTGRKAGKSQAGNDILQWNIPIDLRTAYSTEELKNATVSIIDNLHPSLSYVRNSLTVYERVVRNGKLTRGYSIRSSEYSLTQDGNRLTITLTNPDKYPAVEIQFRTEALASVNELTNEVILDVNGITVKEESKPVPDVVAVGQSGYITSMRAPEWVPEVFKNVDGALCTEDGAFGFTITEVNADGSAMENAYTDTAFNNGEGKAVFKAIEYKTPTDGQTHYYKIAETVCDETKYQKDEKEYLVTVTLTKLTSAYQVTVTVADSEDGTNKITFQNASLIDISGEKVWDDGSDQDRKRPDQVIIHLLADGVETAVQTVTKADGDRWSWTFSNLPKTANGIPITYTVTEETVTGYSTVIEGSTETGFTVTNSYTPDKTSLNVTKVWMDANDQDGMRPGTITVKLLADGAATDKTLVLSKENNWTGTFTDLAKNKAGVPIVYTIEEVAVPGYASAITYQENTSSAMIINFHTPEKIGIYGNKVWDDKNDADSIRPDYIEIQLLANGTVIGSQTVTAGSDGGWRWSFTNLPKYMNGKEIVYTVTETEVEGYTTTITGDTFSGFTIKNSHAAKRPSEGPGTGDNNQPMLWLVLLLVSAAGIAYAAWKLRKKEKR